MNDKFPEYPKDDPRSFGYEVARTAIDAAASVVPGGSYAAGKLVERFVAAPLQKRRDEWFQRVGQGLEELETRLEGFDVSKLDENDDFVSAVFEATQAAMKTAQREKVHALRNGVLNIASGLRLDDVVRGTFFALIERFSPAHLRVLTLLQEPKASPEMVAKAKNMMTGSQTTILRAAWPETVMSDAILRRVLGDLDREGLADTGGMSAMGTSGSLLAKRTTEIGDGFLRFISEPTS